MRQLDTRSVIPVVKELFMKACYELGEQTLQYMQSSVEREESPLGKELLQTIYENAIYAKQEQIACCQDTGTAILYLEIGQEVCWSGPPLVDSLQEGVRQAYSDGYLRFSMLDPLTRINTADNTPAVIHIDIVPGDKVVIHALPKGGGSENMTRMAMLVPAVGLTGVLQFVLETVTLAGGKACPPLVVGVAIGASSDAVTWLAKKALLRPLGERHSRADIAALETEWLQRVNNTGIGPLGMGGRVTAWDLHIEVQECHLTSLPVAVALQCHANRHKSAELA